MPLRLLAECYFRGPALPEPYVEFELERELNRLDLLPKTTGEEGRELSDFWTVYRRRLRELGASDGALRIRRQVIEPLMERLGYARLEDGGKVRTREGDEDGGALLISDTGARLRVWTASFDEDLDAPARRGAAYRFSRVQIANRVLFASGERMGVITNGAEIRMVIGDPARPPSEIVIHIDPEWKRSREVPDAFRLLHALAQPRGLAALPDILDKARVQQARVTSDLRKQAREAVERFAQEVLDHPVNEERLAAFPDRARLARDLWHEGLILVYRLLFLLKMEATDDPARSFRFASSTLWRKTFSPGQALHPVARAVLESGGDTGTFLEDGLRQLFRMFSDGLEASELHVAPLGGILFGEEATPLLQQLAWGERAVAFLLDRLLLTEPGRGDRRYVHYGSLELEDLGRVYENLLELEPGIATEPLCRLKRQKLEVVVPAAQGERYRDNVPPGNDENGEEDGEELEEESAPTRGRTRIEWMGSIAPGRFYLRIGLGRKASGSYYTPNRFVRFLVEQTLGPLVDKVSPPKDPNPAAILKLKVLDPAMGSGHFLVDACRFLGARLYEAGRGMRPARRPAERRAEAAIDEEVRSAALAEAEKYRGRVIAVAEICFRNGEPFGAVCERLGMRLGRELNMTDDAFRFTPVEDVLESSVDPRDPDVAADLLGRAYVVLHEGKTFHQYTDRWEDRPRYVVELGKMAAKPECLRVVPYYRLAFREIAAATNERTVIFAMLRPSTYGHKAPCERAPEGRTNADALAVLAMMNGFPVDWTMRLRVASSVSLFMLKSTPVPFEQQTRMFFAHAALRLTCNHAGYAALWQEQLGCEWRESRPLHCWPVLPDDDSRWDLRAVIDAAVARAYGLTHQQYEHVLSTFSHRSYPNAPAICLAKFDEYATIGPTAFTRKYDPYWDIPLVETLPQPVIELPGIEAHAEEFALNPPPAAPGNRRTRRRR